MDYACVVLVVQGDLFPSATNRNFWKHVGNGCGMAAETLGKTTKDITLDLGKNGSKNSGQRNVLIQEG